MVCRYRQNVVEGSKAESRRTACGYSRTYSRIKKGITNVRRVRCYGICWVGKLAGGRRRTGGCVVRQGTCAERAGRFVSCCPQNGAGKAWEENGARVRRRAAKEGAKPANQPEQAARRHARVLNQRSGGSAAAAGVQRVVRGKQEVAAITQPIPETRTQQHPVAGNGEKHMRNRRKLCVKNPNERQVETGGSRHAVCAQTNRQVVLGSVNEPERTGGNKVLYPMCGRESEW